MARARGEEQASKPRVPGNRRALPRALRFANPDLKNTSEPLCSRALAALFHHSAEQSNGGQEQPPVRHCGTAPPAAARSEVGRSVQLRRRARQVHHLLRGPALRQAATRQPHALARRLRPLRRCSAQCGSGRRVLRRRRQRQVRPADGLLDDDAGVERHRLRQVHGRRAAPRQGRRALGRRLPPQGRHRHPRRALRAGRRPRPRPRVLGAARGHGHPARRVPRRRQQTRLGRGRRDGGRAGGVLRRVPALRPGVLRAPAPRRHGGVRVRRPPPRLLQRLPQRRRVPVLLLLLRVPRRAPVGCVVAAPRVQQRDVHDVRAGVRHAAGRRRRRLLLQLGRQEGRDEGAAVQGVPAAQAAGAGAVQVPLGQLHLLAGPRDEQLPGGPVHAGRADLQGGREQHAVRDHRHVPGAGLRQVPQVRARHGLVRRPRRGAGRPGGAGEAAGGLHPGEEPGGEVVHGGVRGAVSGAGAPPGRVHAVGARAPGPHRLRRRVPVPPRRRGQPERAHRRRARRSRRARQLRRRPRQLRPVGARHLHQRAARRATRVLRRNHQEVQLA